MHLELVLTRAKAPDRMPADAALARTVHVAGASAACAQEAAGNGDAAPERRGLDSVVAVATSDVRAAARHGGVGRAVALVLQRLERHAAVVAQMGHHDLRVAGHLQLTKAHARDDVAANLRCAKPPLDSLERTESGSDVRTRWHDMKFPTVNYSAQANVEPASVAGIQH